MESKWNIIALLGIMMMVIAAPAAGQPPTSFLIDGWVNDSSGDPVNDPSVTVTNLNTDEVFTAETDASSNYYQVMTCSDNVSTNDMLNFSVDGGTAFGHAVMQTEMNAGGVEEDLTVEVEEITTTYNFTTGAGIDKWAYRYQSAMKPPITNDDPGIEFANSTNPKKDQYIKISTDDRKMQSDSTDAVGNYSAHRFVFDIAQPVERIVKIGVLWNGKGAHTDKKKSGATLYIWNGTGYEELANTTGNREVCLTAEVTAEIGSYIDATGNMTILVEQNSAHALKGKRSLTSKIGTDYVKVDITHT